MESLLSFLIWAGLIVLMIGLGRDSRSNAQERTRLLWPFESSGAAKPDLRWVPPEKDVDPVCAKTVSTARANPSVHAGLVYYFCSRECREVFEAAPDLYVGHRRASRPELERSHA